jgi:4-diphosphocytidyl-2-C-methyl-D-erythritol kinase
MRPDRLTLQAPAKINLFLRVTGRRPDGYHLLETLMQKVCLYDVVELAPCAEGIHLHCSGGEVPAHRDNLVYRAAELFFQATRERRNGSASGVVIRLTKRIPVAAGLGGGSSDAAVTLRGLNELFGCGCRAEELAELGVRLGADVPFFLAETPAALATGIGEVLQPVEPLRGYSVLLVNPGFSVSTRWVYQTFALTKPEGAGNLGNSCVGVVGAAAPSGLAQTVLSAMVLVNDLETITLASYPEIGRLKDGLLRNGADRALMSGSGPTVFALFAERRSAEACYAFFKRQYPYTYLVAPVGER